jgi:hypothetical protein
MLPDETTFTEVRREENFHTQFRVAEEGLQLIVLELVAGQCIVIVIVIRISVI